VSCDLVDNMRVPYPSFSATDGFLASGSVNGRLSDAIRGTNPLLKYKYYFSDLDSGSEYRQTKGETERYAPSLVDGDDFEECGYYTINSFANSLNRCEGDIDGPELSRKFQVNYVPRVLSIEPLENPNDGVSGNKDSQGPDEFGCSVDNPKTFRVTFRDDGNGEGGGKGCGDLYEGFDRETNICGGVQDPILSLQAIDADRPDRVFAESSSPTNCNLPCESSL